MDAGSAEEAAIRAHAVTTFCSILAAALFLRAILISISQLRRPTFENFLKRREPVIFDDVDLNCSEPPSLSTVMNTAAARRYVNAWPSSLDR